MPIYDFSCPKEGCNGFKVDVYQPFTSSIPPECADCGSGMERVYSISLVHRAASAFPYVTRNITPDGKPVEVRSAQHLKELCARYKVTPRDDQAFIEKRYEGWDFRTGKQKYRESSGMGMPGTWF